MVRRVLCIAGLAVALGAPALAADAVFPQGSRIGIVPPKTMKPTPGVTGFSDPATGAAIVAIELPAGAYPGVAAGFTDEALKAQGFTLQSRETPTVGSAPAILVSGEQGEAGRSIPKTVLLASEPTMTALVIAQLPPGASPAQQAEMRTALKTVAFRPALPIAEQVAALPFRIGDFAGFRTVRVMAGNSILLTAGPKDQILEAEQPVVIVAQSVTPPPPAEQRDNFARALLSANTMLKEIVVERSQPFRQAGSDWHEIVAKAKDGPSDEPVLVMQTIRFAPGSYTRMVAIAKVGERDEALPRFRRLADTISLR